MKLSDIKVGQEVVLRKGIDAIHYKVEGLNGFLVRIKEIGPRNYEPQTIDYSLIHKITKQA